MDDVKDVLLELNHNLLSLLRDPYVAYQMALACGERPGLYPCHRSLQKELMRIQNEGIDFIGMAPYAGRRFVVAIDNTPPFLLNPREHQLLELLLSPEDRDLPADDKGWIPRDALAAAMGVALHNLSQITTRLRDVMQRMGLGRSLVETHQDGTIRVRMWGDGRAETCRLIVLTEGEEREYRAWKSPGRP